MMNPTPSAFLNAFTAGLLLGGVGGCLIGGLLASFYWTKLICGYLVREDEQVTEILGRGVECRACGQGYLDKEPCCPRCGVAERDPTPAQAKQDRWIKSCREVAG